MHRRYARAGSVSFALLLWPSVAFAHGQDSIAYVVVLLWTVVALGALLLALVAWAYRRAVRGVRRCAADIGFIANASVLGLLPFVLAYAAAVPERLLLVLVCTLGAANFLAAKRLWKLGRS